MDDPVSSSGRMTDYLICLTSMCGTQYEGKYSLFPATHKNSLWINFSISHILFKFCMLTTCTFDKFFASSQLLWVFISIRKYSFGYILCWKWVASFLRVVKGLFVIREMPFLFPVNCEMANFFLVKRDLVTEPWTANHRFFTKIAKCLFIFILKCDCKPWFSFSCKKFSSKCFKKQDYV